MCDRKTRKSVARKERSRGSESPAGENESNQKNIRLNGAVPSPTSNRPIVLFRNTLGERRQNRGASAG